MTAGGQIYNSLMRNVLVRCLPAALMVAVTFATKIQPQSVTRPISDDSVYVGILDDAREDLEDGKTELIKRRVVMPAFEKRDSEWHTVTHFWLHSVKWTVAFDGKNIG